MNAAQGIQKQKVDDLQFYLYHRPLHPELFHIHQVKHIEQRRYQAEIWIVGLSHVVTFQAGDQYMTELIATESDLLPKNGQLTTFRFRGERDHVQSFKGGEKYILSSQVEKMAPHLFPASHRELMRYGRKRSMYNAFDDWGNEGMAPFSFIDFEAREQEFHVHAFHAFPDDMTVLKTQSIFEIGPPKSAN